MRAHVVILAALLGAAAAAPQLVLSQKSHRGLEQALGGRVPVGVYSASRIYKGYEGNSNNVVVLNIPGLTHALGENFDAFDSHSSEENELVVLARAGTAGAAALPGPASPVTRTGPLLTAVLDSFEDQSGSLEAPDDFRDALEDAAEDARDDLEDARESLEEAAQFALTRSAAPGAGVPLSVAAAAAASPGAASSGGVPLNVAAAVAATPGAAASVGVPLSAAAAAAGAPVPNAAASGGVPLSAAGVALGANPIGGFFSDEIEEELFEARQDIAELQGLRSAAAAAAAAGNTLLAGQLMREVVEEAAESARDAAEDAAELEATRRAAAAASAAGNNFLAGQLMAEAAEEAAEIALKAATNAQAARGMATFAQEMALRARVVAVEAAENAREFAEFQQEAAEDAAEAALNIRLGFGQGAAGNTGGVPLPGLVRRKRSFGGSDDDAEDEFALTPAEEGAFALSSLGTLMGANVGRWFDESYDANVKFFRGLEVTGNIVLSQLDDMLAEDKD